MSLLFYRTAFIHFQVECLLRELCRLHNINVPNEATILLSGEGASASGSGSTSGCTSASASETVNEGAKSMDHGFEEPNEDGYGSDSSVSSLDSDDYGSLTRLEKTSPSKNAPPLKKAHMDVLNKLVS